MNYDVVEIAATTLSANFTTDLGTLLTAKGESGDSSLVGVNKRVALGVWGTEPENLPGLGVRSLSAVTRAKVVAKRDSRVDLVIEYYAMGQDAAVLGAQVELAAEAILLSVDRIAEAGTTVWGAGEEPDSVTVEIFGTAHSKGQDWYEDGCRVTITANDRDVV